MVRKNGKERALLKKIFKIPEEKKIKTMIDEIVDDGMEHPVAKELLYDLRRMGYWGILAERLYKKIAEYILGKES